MPSYCAVADCHNNADNSKENGIIFHRFPFKNRKRSKHWESLCKRRTKIINYKNACVCSVHFKSEDYKRDLMNELLGCSTRKILKPDAVPSVFPNRSQPRENTTASRTERAAVRERKRVVLQALSHNQIQSDLTEEDSSEANLPEEPSQPAPVILQQVDSSTQTRRFLECNIYLCIY